MRLADLGERSGVPLATVKYYLREGLLPPGRRINATQSEYDESHLRRLRLVRAMIQVGRIPVATVREVLAHVDDDSLGRTVRLGAALWALPHPAEETPGTPPDVEDPSRAAALLLVDELLDRLGWSTARELGALSPAHRALVSTLATLHRLGYPLGADDLLPYARTMEQAAVHDLDRTDLLPTDRERAEYAVASAVLFEPVLLNLRRLAQSEESSRRHGL
ncbi:MerR family transcriptional regulator [Kitasatospora sp. NA04385]|uniref:MerR family transcriptional regulator n=1 Tax=Kitasatospora sp. NA04385 TaxID=2742135 RepID=UPI0015903824|nr:MerR family transcriptional regulator [Kitasatospora sp. NA04385]QKW18118.1 MerR family transcriptional regulator [Kitasatospora sp. NA04385]